MELNQWQQIKQVCRKALTQPIAQREDFLTQACAGNEVLRYGVETLLTYHLNEVRTKEGGRSVTTQLLVQEDEEMTPERRQHIEKIFQAAADCKTEGLADFLDQACGGDDD